MTFQKLLLALSLSALAFGCGTTVDKQIAPTSKTQAKQDQKDNPDTDYCELYNWYGDGECDDFCPEEDSDCSVANCAAVPVCAPNELDVPNCDDDSYFNCREETLCGATIYCAEQTGCASDALGADELRVAVGCPDDYQEVDFCEGNDDSDDCLIFTECGNSTYCERETNCLEQPTCPADTMYVEECAPGDTCQLVQACNAYVTCAPSYNCEAFPSCDQGDTEVATMADCAQDIACYQNHICGYTVTCSDTARPEYECNEQPVCPDGSNEVEECTSSNCTITSTVCGTRLLCQE